MPQLVLKSHTSMPNDVVDAMTINTKSDSDLSPFLYMPILTLFLITFQHYFDYKLDIINTNETLILQEDCS